MSATAPLFLYVEDDAPSRTVMQFLIGRILGAHVEVFEDTTNFVERLRSLPGIPRVIFLDTQIAPLNGYQVLTLLRGLHEYESTPIIAMTASVTRLDVEQIRDAGFDGLIGKPIKSQVFLDLLKRIMAGESVWYVM